MGVLKDSSVLQQAIRAATRDVERSFILAALVNTGGNIHASSRLLGISRPTLYVRLREFGITDEQVDRLREGSLVATMPAVDSLQAGMPT